MARLNRSERGRRATALLAAGCVLLGGLVGCAAIALALSQDAAEAAVALGGLAVLLGAVALVLPGRSPRPGVDLYRGFLRDKRPPAVRYRVRRRASKTTPTRRNEPPTAESVRSLSGGLNNWVPGRNTRSADPQKRTGRCDGGTPGLWLLLLIAAASATGPLFPLVAAERQLAAPHPMRLLPRPAADDDTAAALRAFQQEFRELYGGHDRAVPLEAKAEYLQWVLEKYCCAPHGIVYHTVVLPAEVGTPPEYTYGADVSTWNGALLAALSYKYAVTRDAPTLALIERVLDGLHLSIEVTGQPGLIARCVLRRDEPLGKVKHRYQAPDGTVYHYRSDPAKGTYNQVVGGYAVLLMLAADALPPARQRQAREDLAALVGHLVDHDYHLTERDGERTPYGNLTPLVGPQGVPFNAQVAYAIIAAGHRFPGEDLIRRKMVRREFERLRGKHHAYYESPLRSWITPQHVGASPLVKGMNDRNHVHNAAYLGLMLELAAATEEARPPDAEFLYQLGQTMFWTMEHIQHQRNSLCNFMWAAVLKDPAVFDAVVPLAQERTRRQIEYVMAAGIEQLRRYPLDRFYHTGRKVETRQLQWVDAQRPDEVYRWKAGPFSRWEITGPPTDTLTCAIDYLHAYWLMRYHRLDSDLDSPPPISD